MPIDDDIPNILELDEGEKLVHTLHRTYLSVAFTVIFGAIFLDIIIFIYAAEFIFDPDIYMYTLPVFIPLFILIPVIIILIGLFVGKWYAGGHLFLITTKRILFYTKFVNKTMRELKFSKITDTQFEQGPFGRIFNYANITFATPGMEGMGMGGVATFFFSIKGINDGLKIRESVIDLIEMAEEEA
ncbi:MAG: PH domain-containing protein [Candidatus Lokiarchaeota archaeon]|nr:PH domain-containing protein [Candidatus Lokiarchaeota archaeon]